MSEVILAVKYGRMSSLNAQQMNEIELKRDINSVTNWWDTFLDKVFGCHRCEIKQAYFNFTSPTCAPLEKKDAFFYLQSAAKLEYKTFFSIAFDAEKEMSIYKLDIPEKTGQTPRVSVEQRLEPSCQYLLMSHMFEKQHHAQVHELMTKLDRGVTLGEERYQAISDVDRFSAFMALYELAKPKYRKHFKVEAHTHINKFSLRFKEYLVDELREFVTHDYFLQKFIQTMMEQQLIKREQAALCTTDPSAIKWVPVYGGKLCPSRFKEVMQQDLERDPYTLANEDETLIYAADDGITGKAKLDKLQALCSNTFQSEMLTMLASQSLCLELPEFDMQLRTIILYGQGEATEPNKVTGANYHIIKLSDGSLLVSSCCCKQSNCNPENPSHRPKGESFADYSQSYQGHFVFLITKEEVFAITKEIHKQPFSLPTKLLSSRA